MSLIIHQVIQLKDEVSVRTAEKRKGKMKQLIKNIIHTIISTVGYMLGLAAMFYFTLWAMVTFYPQVHNVYLMVNENAARLVK